jgi:uncharacterized membrane protein YebE (DUF533 family)
MKKLIFAAVFFGGAIAPLAAQTYNNQALENYYRQQDQRERQNEQMREQQQFNEQIREQHQRDISRHQLW